MKKAIYFLLAGILTVMGLAGCSTGKDSDDIFSIK